MDIFQFENYKEFVNKWVLSQPKLGRGKYREMSQTLRTSPTIVSQIFKGNRDLSLEQAALLCEYFKFSESESDYFLMLVLKARSGNEPLRKLVRRGILRAQKKSQELKNRLPSDAKLPETVQSTFYSHWYYSGIRNLVAVPGFQSAEEISARLGLPRQLVKEALQFLLENGLCVQKNGRIEVGPKRTHLGSDSPLALRHRVNWRLKAFERYPHYSEKEISYTSPMSLSQEAMAKVRAELVSVIERANRLMADSPSETVACLNIDWFSY